MFLHYVHVTPVRLIHTPVLTSPVSHGHPGEFWPVPCGDSLDPGKETLFLCGMDICAGQQAHLLLRGWVGLRRSKCLLCWYHWLCK